MASVVNIQEGSVVASYDGLYLLVLDRGADNDQWLCLVLGDFYQESDLTPLEPGCLDMFSICVDTNWEIVTS